MKKTLSNNILKILVGTVLVALPFAFGGCEKDPVKPNNGNNNNQQKHNVELVYGTNPNIQWQNISMDTINKYNSDKTVDTIFMIPEIYNQYSTISTTGLKNLVGKLRERHNVNPDKIFGKGEMQLDADAVRDNYEIVRFFADTLKYKVTYYNHAKSR